MYPSHLLRKKGRILCFVEFITMLSTLPRIVGPFRGIFTKSLGRGPWSSPKRSLRCKGTLYPTTKGNEWWL